MTVAVAMPLASAVAATGVTLIKPGPKSGGVKVITLPGPTGSPPVLLSCTTSGWLRGAPKYVVWWSPPVIDRLKPCIS